MTKEKMMHPTTREFLVELKELFDKYERGPYKVELDVVESCHGYDGWFVEGVEIGVPVMKTFDDGDSYHSTEYVSFSGKYITPDDIAAALKES